MRNELVKINNQEITVKIFNNKRVVTFKDIDLVHNRPEGTAKRNFNTNKKYLIEKEDFFEITRKEFSTKFVPNLKIEGNPNLSIFLLTESGYLMLVKSFSDELAWIVQRQLVNSYFKVNQVDKKNNGEEKIKLAEAKLMNAKTRMASMYYKLSNVETLSKEYKNILVSKASEVLSGQEIIPLPKLEQKTYTATELGKMFGVSKNKIGIITNKYNLKTKEYGEWYKDKAEYSAKDVDTFRYYNTIIPKISEILNLNMA